MLLVQPIQKVNLGNTTFILYCVNMFIHGHRKILSYIKLGRHVFSHFSRPQSSRQFLADAASQRSVVPPHKTVGRVTSQLWTCVKHVPKQSIP